MVTDMPMGPTSLVPQKIQRGHPLHLRLKTRSLPRHNYPLRSQRRAVARGVLESHCPTKRSPRKPPETQKRLKGLSAPFLLLVHWGRPPVPAEQGPAKGTGQLETAADPDGLDMGLSPQSTRPSPPRGSKRSESTRGRKRQDAGVREARPLPLWVRGQAVLWAWRNDSPARPTCPRRRWGWGGREQKT